MAGSNLPFVWEKVIARLVTLIDDPPDATLAPSGWPVLALQGVSEGEKMSVGSSPWAMVFNDTFNKPPDAGGVQLEATRWVLTIRLVCDWDNDETEAERVLMILIEQVSDTFRANTKLGIPSIVADSGVRAGDWGYILLGEVTYRTLDLRLEVTEKSLASRVP